MARNKRRSKGAHEDQPTKDVQAAEAILFEEPLQTADEWDEECMSFQRQWLNHRLVRWRIRTMGGLDTKIKARSSNVTYRDLKTRPYPNWHKWMELQIKILKHTVRRREKRLKKRGLDQLLPLSSTKPPQRKTTT